MSESLKGKVAVISGAASGFAKATAELFAKMDQCNLVIFDIDKPVSRLLPKIVKQPVPKSFLSKVT